jgi:hypothetical protein
LSFLILLRPSPMPHCPLSSFFLLEWWKGCWVPCILICWRQVTCLPCPKWQYVILLACHQGCLHIGNSKYEKGMLGNNLRPYHKAWNYDSFGYYVTLVCRLIIRKKQNKFFTPIWMCWPPFVSFTRWMANLCLIAFYSHPWFLLLF